MYYSIFHKKLKMFLVVETMENNQRMCTAVPEAWIHDNILVYPDKSKFNKYRRTVMAPEDDWKTINCTIISKKFGKCFILSFADYLLNCMSLYFKCVFYLY